MRDGNNSRGGNGRGRYNNRRRNGGGGRGGNRRHNNRRGNWRGRGRNQQGNRGRYGRSSHKSGNLRERIAVESGYLVIIDQFMLANPQFQAELSELIDQEPESKDKLIEKFGGTVVELSPGNYRILRNPYSNRIVIHDSGQDDIDFEEVIANAPESTCAVLIDTRCLAMIDRELLDDTDLLQKYQELWFSDQDKACRDLLRDNGGAVRYGFQRFGDELDVYYLKDENTVCLAAKDEELQEDQEVQKEMESVEEQAA